MNHDSNSLSKCQFFVKYGAILLLFCSFCSSAIADDWFGHDKYQHFAVSAALGIGASAITTDTNKAVALALIPGVLKEVLDSQEDGNHFSGKDLVWDAFGAIVGVKIGKHFFITDKRLNFQVTF